MIRRKAEPRPTLQFLSTPSPDTSPRSSAVVSDCDADDEETMSMEDIIPTSDPRGSAEIGSRLLYAPTRPTLPDVLSNCAPPPWTLSAFTAYLSNNHCLENLEFTMDAERYRERYDTLAATPTAGVEETRYVRMLWQRLLDAYIIPDGPREINIPSDVRDRLLSLPNQTNPPAPDELSSAVKIIYKLMEESVLVSFLNEAPAPSTRNSKPSLYVKPNPADVVLRKRGGSDSSHEKKSNRSKSRRRGSPSHDDRNDNTSINSNHNNPFSTSDPTGRLTPGGITLKTGRAPSHTSNGSADPGLSTDDSNGLGSPIGEPMTPPHTPPSSEFGGASPKQKNDIGWKKMLGWKKRTNNGSRDFRSQSHDE